MKRVRNFATLLLFGLVAGLGSAWAEGPPSPAARIPGVFDPKTKTFTAFPWSRGSPGAAAATSTSKPASTTTATTVVHGTLVVKLVLALNPAVPNGSITADVQTSVFDPSAAESGVTYTSNGGAYGTLTRSGFGATGTFTIPFVATVNASTYQVLVSAYNVGVENDGSSVGPQLNFQRSIPVPANGSTTTVTLQGDL